VVLIRAWLVLLFFQRTSGAAWLMGFSEVFALLSTIRGLVRENLETRWSGVLTPLCYCTPMLFHAVPVEQAVPAFVLVLVAILVLQFYLRFYMGWSVTVGAPMYVKLLKSGPYTLIRHPLSTLEITMVAVYALAFPDCWNLVIGAISVSTVALSIKLEERYLMQFESYRIYARNVPGAIWPFHAR